ncbi:MAG: FkbM family methyltransferase [Thermodesulfobacteriota bacterium]
MKRFLFQVYSRLFARKFFYSFNKALFLLGLRGLGIYPSVTGEEHLVLNLLPKIINNPEPVLFDVGANIGKYSLMLRKSFPNGRIHCFEPDPINFDILKKIEAPNIYLYNHALGDKESILKLYVMTDKDKRTHSTYYKEVITEIHKGSFTDIDVQVNTIDKIAELKKIEYIDFLKIDTEGSELNILKGATKLIENRSIGLIQFEFNAMNVISKVFFRDIRNILENYDFYRLLPKGLIRIEENYLYSELFALQNILAVEKSKNLSF